MPSSVKGAPQKLIKVQVYYYSQFYPKKGYTKGLGLVQGGPQQKIASLRTKTRTTNNLQQALESTYT